MTVWTLLLLSGPATAAVPGEGELVITEVMPAPADNTYREWFEVFNPTATPMELDGCRLIEGSGSSWTAHAVSALTVDPGAYAVLSRETSSTPEACVGWPEAGQQGACLATAGYRYTSLGLSNSSAETLCILCGTDGDNSNDSCNAPGAGEVIVDAAPVDWAAFSGDCETSSGKGCAINFGLTTPDAAGNDDLANWCLVEDAYYDADSEDNTGTPGRGFTACAETGSSTDDTGIDDTGIDDTGIVVEGDPCGAGDVLINELMPAPRDSASADEWIELRGADGLSQCQLYRCTLSQLDPETREVVTRSGDIPLVITLNADLLMSAGEHAVLARSNSRDREDGISWTSQTDSATTQAAFLWDYNDFNLSNTEARLLSLQCEGTIVDEVTLDWSAFEGEAGQRCPGFTGAPTTDPVGGGCSVNLGPWVTDAADNDSLGRWCIPPDDLNDPTDNYWTHTSRNDDGTYSSYTILATPGVENACPRFNRPCPNEIIFTEVMADGAGIEDWLELTNLTEGDLELTGCTLMRYRIDPDSGEPTDIVSDRLGDDGQEPVLLGLTSRVFAKGGCLDETEQDTASPLHDPADCSFNEFAISSLSFTLDNDEHLALYCPNYDNADCPAEDEGPEGTLIDDMNYNWGDQGVRDGHSLMLDPDVIDYADLAATAAANDDRANWCEAAFNDAAGDGVSGVFLEIDEESCNYGSPNDLGVCETFLPDRPGQKIACRCSAGGPGAALWVLLTLPLVLLRRRRERV